MSVSCISGDAEFSILKYCPLEIISPPSSTENISVDPSYKFNISAVPLCVIATPTTVLLFAPTSIRSTPIKFVSSVVVVPSTVKLLLTLRS